MTDLTSYNVSLTAFNSLALNATADVFSCCNSDDDVLQSLAYAADNDLKLTILGGGSNTVLSDRISGLVMHMASKGIELINETQEQVTLSVAAGENWDDFLRFCLDNGYYGLENLAIIPGTVGAAPIQNIGAYGQQVSDCFESVNGINTQSLQYESYSNQQCQFAYRDSLFKTQLANRFVVCRVSFVLQKNFRANLSYTALKDYLVDHYQQAPTPVQIRKAVIAIRQQKLPDPRQLANAGSFFKNPVINDKLYQQLKLRYPDMPSYPQAGESFKIAAAWLIEQAGFKGKRYGNVGMYEKQALVLVNYGGASFADIEHLVSKIQQKVFQCFGIQLEQEPVLVA